MHDVDIDAQFGLARQQIGPNPEINLGFLIAHALDDGSAVLCDVGGELRNEFLTEAIARAGFSAAISAIAR